MNKLLNHPVIHILIFGLLLGIILITVFGAKLPSKEDKRIIINDADFAHILASWEKTWQRPPTKEEFQNVLENYVRDEVVYQEALNQHLDENNASVKRSLIMQMNMLAESQGSSENITEDDLKAYYELRKEKYLKPAEITFSQIYFSNKVENSKDVLVAIKNQLNANNTTPDNVSDVGESIMLESNFKNIATNKIDYTLGENVSQQLLELPLNSWQGPIASSFGSHLVYISQVNPEEPLPIEAVKNELLRELQYEGKDAAKEQFYTELMQQYEIIYKGEIKEFFNEK
ncbi:peptidyl-prolyl cis-trans isomerase [Xanthomarina sp. GH4-25]|uniref:peptidylprolyl isomerase n=1 Tax=Xanthomarina sp. GH4-25 TaxID=3349335 RepID=UPI003877EEAE